MGPVEEKIARLRKDARYMGAEVLAFEPAGASPEEVIAVAVGLVRALSLQIVALWDAIEVVAKTIDDSAG